MRRSFPTFMLYTFSFLLLLEWIVPLKFLTNSGIGIFIFFLLILFFSDFIGLKWFWKLFITLLFISVSINRLYYIEPFFSFSWIHAFSIHLKKNLVWLLSGNVKSLSDEFRTLVFFLLLWLAFYVIHYLLFTRRNMFIFFFMTLVYITVLDTFTRYSAKWAIVRTVIIGFMAMGMLTYSRISEKEKRVNSSFVRKWMVPLSAMIAISLFIGLTAPKVSSLLPTPALFLKVGTEKSEAAGIGGVHTVGYGTDDSALGGPFKGDNHPVFLAEASGKYYWKVETKDTYTGKGWIVSPSKLDFFKKGDPIPIVPFPYNIATSKDSARIVVNSGYGYNHIVYPAGIQRISQIQPNDKGNDFTIDPATQKILFWNSKQRPVIPNQYTLEFEIPMYNAVDLMKTTAVDYSQVSSEFMKQYTQLPGKLPARIKELAQKITAGKNSWFEKAKAIESYFSSPDYTYDQKNVAVPGAGVDYVDQFLFDTKRGYCDNFSTSMAVMMRTLGIPARWVKGYTGGEFKKYSPTNPSKQLYQITNNNAHSWVEVFFPNQGWVPFEPTKGYSSDVIIHYGATEQTLLNPSPTTAPLPVKKPEKTLQEDAVPSQSKKIEANSNKAVHNAAAMFIQNWRILSFMMVIIGIIAAILYWSRGKWMPYYLLLTFRFRKSDKNIETAYLVLLKQLNRYGIKRKKNQTLRSYAGYIDSFFSTREMTRLTVFYEEFLYHQHLPQGSWKEVRELWENLIKKTIY